MTPTAGRTCKPREIDGGLRLSHPPEDTAGLGTEGEDVSRPAQIDGARLPVGEDLDRGGPVV